MPTSPLLQQNYFGLFELDDSGTVLYSRIEPDAGSDGSSRPDVRGRNFFKEVLPFENGEEFRQRVAQFSRRSLHADNFIFHCRIKSTLLPVRVLLVRTEARADRSRTKSILLHIRKSSP